MPQNSGAALSVLAWMTLAGCGDRVGEDAPADPTEESCADLTEDAAAFIESNRACETAMDCQSVDKGCYAGPQVQCVEVALATSADLDVWQDHLDGLAEACPMECGGPECGADIQCIDNRCTAVF